MYKKNLRNFREFKSSRKIRRHPIREIQSTRKKTFFSSFFRISKTYILTFGSLPINDGYVKNILQNIKQSRIKSFISQ